MRQTCVQGTGCDTPKHSLANAIGCTHDLGHPPFGHGGEVALNYCMRKHGGFEGNGQTLRIVTKLEKFSEESGSNLSRRTLLGVLKYPAPYERTANPDLLPKLADDPTSISIIDRKSSTPPKCYFDTEKKVVDWILDPLTQEDRDTFTSICSEPGEHHETRYKSFDCSIMDLADDISFGVHDLEDALSLKLIGEEEIRKFVPQEKCTNFLDKLHEKYPQEMHDCVYDRFVEALLGDGRTRKRMIGRMINYFVTHCGIQTLDAFCEPLIRFKAVVPPEPQMFLDSLIEAVKKAVILSPHVQHLEFKGQKLVVSVFEALNSDPRSFLPKDTLQLYEKSKSPVRVMCGYRVWGAATGASVNPRTRTGICGDGPLLCVIV